MLYQLIAVIGAIVMLGSYLALQRGWLAATDRSYNILNFIGASLLTWVAIVDRRWGFILVEGAWALLSVPGMFQRRAPAEPRPG